MRKVAEATAVEAGVTFKRMVGEFKQASAAQRAAEGQTEDARRELGEATDMKADLKKALKGSNAAKTVLEGEKTSITNELREEQRRRRHLETELQAAKLALAGALSAASLGEVNGGAIASAAGSELGTIGGALATAAAVAVAGAAAKFAGVSVGNLAYGSGSARKFAGRSVGSLAYGSGSARNGGDGRDGGDVAPPPYSLPEAGAAADADVDAFRVYPVVGEGTSNGKGGPPGGADVDVDVELLTMPKFMASLSLEHLVPLLEEAEVDMQSLLLVDDTHLVGLGIRLGARKKLLNALLQFPKELHPHLCYY